MVNDIVNLQKAQTGALAPDNKTRIEAEEMLKSMINIAAHSFKRFLKPVLFNIQSLGEL